LKLHPNGGCATPDMFTPSTIAAQYVEQLKQGLPAESK
jgi:hypothetical protein